MQLLLLRCSPQPQQYRVPLDQLYWLPLHHLIRQLLVLQTLKQQRLQRQMLRQRQLLMKCWKAALRVRCCQVPVQMMVCLVLRPMHGGTRPTAMMSLKILAMATYVMLNVCQDSLHKAECHGFVSKARQEVTGCQTAKFSSCRAQCRSQLVRSEWCCIEA
jgi:hypothetical protein